MKRVFYNNKIKINKKLLSCLFSLTLHQSIIPRHTHSHSPSTETSNNNLTMYVEFLARKLDGALIQNSSCSLWWY